jgi:anti-sigma factor RsiW
MRSVHLDTEQIQRLLHGELSGSQATAVHDHLGACEPCRRLVDEAQAGEAEVHTLLRQLDHAPPPLRADMVVAKARARRPGWIRWAAGIVLALGAVGGAYAAPGSPLPGLIETIVNRMRGPRAPATAEGSPQAPGPEVAGIAVAAGRRLAIVFTTSRPEGRAIVSLTEGPEVVVRAVSGAATFTSDVERLVIDNVGSTAVFEIEIPRDAPRVEILVGSRRVFVKQGPRITTEAPADSLGQYGLPLAAPGPATEDMR